MPPSLDAPALLATRELAVDYPRRLPGFRGWFKTERKLAVAAATVSLRAGETVGIVGESGSGKSTLAAAILNLISRRSGAIEFEGRPIGDASRRERRALARHLQVVFQDPLLLALQRKYGISYLVISHDLAVVNAMAHRVYVMKDGEIVETGETEAVLKAPRHPYTQSLVAAL